MNTPQLGILEIETLLKVAKFRNEKARKSLDHSINLRLTTWMPIQALFHTTPKSIYETKIYHIFLPLDESSIWKYCYIKFLIGFSFLFILSCGSLNSRYQLNAI